MSRNWESWFDASSSGNPIDAGFGFVGANCFVADVGVGHQSRMKAWTEVERCRVDQRWDNLMIYRIMEVEVLCIFVDGQNMPNRQLFWFEKM